VLRTDAVLGCLWSQLAVGLVGEAGNQAGAHSARETDPKWPTRTHAPHTEGRCHPGRCGATNVSAATRFRPIQT
jgi:hypothetical protein